MTGNSSPTLAVALALILAAPAAAQLGISDSFAFLDAVKTGDGQNAVSLLTAPGFSGANTRDRSSGDGALHYVVRNRDLAFLHLLLSKGARPDLQNNRGDTPLGAAVQIGWIGGAQKLLARGAIIDLANAKGETPLILAVHKRDLAMVRLLLSRGANPNKADNLSGYSAIGYAKGDARSAPILKLLEAQKK